MLPLLAFVVTFAFTYPGVIVISDEAKYIRQANAFAQREITVKRIDAVTLKRKEERPSDYPVGTSLVLIPFVVTGGWQRAFWMPAIALVLATLFTALALRAARWSPWYSLVILIFPPALVMARVATSDVVSASVVALGWWLFWLGARELDHHSHNRLCWLGAGFVAGISVLFRETNALLFFPLFVGSVIRKNKGWIWLLEGGLIGTVLRLVSAAVVFGDPLFVKDPGFGFSVGALVSYAPVYLVALTVFVPGGLIFVADYRGCRAPEVIATVAMFVLFYMAYEYSGQLSGFLKSLVLGPRFFIPLLPVMAFAMGESAPRLVGKLPGRERICRWSAPVAVGLTVIIVVMVNIAFAQWTRTQEHLQSAIIENVPPGAPVITNEGATEKFLTELQGYSIRADYHSTNPAEVAKLDGTYLVFLQRQDSEYWIDDAERTNKFISAVPTEAVLDRGFTKTDRLRILRVVGDEGIQTQHRHSGL